MTAKSPAQRWSDERLVRGLPYVGAVAWRQDPDRFLASLFAAPHLRPALWALIAFNCEIARTREVVSEPVLGQIRLQWWRERIEELTSGRAVDHEILVALNEFTPVISRLGIKALHRLVDAREQDLDDSPCATLDQFLSYVRETSTPLGMLMLAALGVEDADSCSAGENIAIAFALAGVLRAVPYMARHGQVRLPLDLLTEHGTTVPGILSQPQAREPLTGAVRVLADIAADHLRLARRHRRTAAAAARPVLILGALTDHYLTALARCRWDVFQPRLSIAHRSRLWTLAWAAFTGRW